jgi:hypothetical protein
MDQKLSYLAYSPPKSNSHGHGVRHKNVKLATQKVIDSFVGLFNATNNDTLSLTLYYDKKTELDKANKTIEKLTEYLGPTIREWDNEGFEYMQNTVNWESKTISIIELLDYIENIKDDSYLPLSKYWISTFYLYGNAETHSHIMLSIEAGRLFIRLHLIIPYEINDKKCYELLTKLQQSLPFKLNSKHFRRLGPSSRGYGQWKLDEETQNKLDICLNDSQPGLSKNNNYKPGI